MSPQNNHKQDDCHHLEANFKVKLDLRPIVQRLQKFAWQKDEEGQLQQDKKLIARVGTW